MSAPRRAARPRMVSRPKVRSMHTKETREKAKLEKERALIQKQQDRLDAKARTLDEKIAIKKSKIEKLEKLWELSADFTTKRRSSDDEYED